MHAFSEHPQHVRSSGIPNLHSPGASVIEALHGHSKSMHSPGIRNIRICRNPYIPRSVHNLRLPGHPKPAYSLCLRNPYIARTPAIYIFLIYTQSKYYPSIHNLCVRSLGTSSLHSLGICNRYIPQGFAICVCPATPNL
ncbi:hypothetical protein Tcan_00903, partial [Toxocara canis]